MKDVSFFLLKNSLGAKMRRGFRSSCNGNDSTSTLNQQEKIELGSCKVDTPPRVSSPVAPTLEEMILQLEMEEEMARRAKYSDCYDNNNDDKNANFLPGRMSCVNSSDILRSARNALNQYPRFSLDGKDAMYRSSFRRQLDRSADVAKPDGRRSFCGDHHRRTRRYGQRNINDHDGSCLPRTVAGESVVWCKPSVVAKLMGLEVIPVPVRGKPGKEKLCCAMRREQVQLRRREKERRSLGMEISGYDGLRRGKVRASCPKGGYCVMKPVVAADPVDGLRFL